MRMVWMMAWLCSTWYLSLAFIKEDILCLLQEICAACPLYAVSNEGVRGEVPGVLVHNHGSKRH